MGAVAATADGFRVLADGVVKGPGGERNVGGHAYKDAEHYPDQRADANKEPRSPSVFPDSHTDYPRLPRNSRSRTHKGPWCGLGCRGRAATERRDASAVPGPSSGYASSSPSLSRSFGHGSKDPLRLF